MNKESTVHPKDFRLDWLRHSGEPVISVSKTDATDWRVAVLDHDDPSLVRVHYFDHPKEAHTCAVAHGLPVADYDQWRHRRAAAGYRIHAV